ncbi:MAG TPA: NUDIX hydrolase [Candidatus Binatia bacterium]|nr:NUDIX hydrolase [Candidatus Binatia bacterium]
MPPSANVVRRRVVHEGRVFEVAIETVRLPNGVQVDLDVLRHRGAAAIVPVTDAGEIVLLRQFRHAAGGELWEIPAGTLDAGEKPEACAHRELVEETGMRAREMIDLGEIVPVPGYSTERIRLYLARGLTPAKQALDEDELISEVRLVPASEAARWAVDGTIVDAKSVVGICRARERGLLAIAPASGSRP